MRYFVVATPVAARTRSAQVANALGCDMQTTRYWWHTHELLDNTGVIVVDDDRDDFKAIARGLGLTAEEIAALLTRRQLGPTKLRDMISFSIFRNRLTAQQIDKIQQLRANNADLDAWISEAQSTGMVDLIDPITLRIIERMLRLDIITMDDIDNLLKFQGA